MISNAFLLIDITPKQYKDSSNTFTVYEEEGVYAVRDTEGNTVATIKKRTVYPKTFCRVIKEGVALGYKGEDEFDEFLIILIHNDGTVHIERDLYATLPLFYTWQNDRFKMSNRYNRLVDISMAVNNEHLLNVLVPNPDYHQTMYKNISILDERHSLEVSSGSLSLTQPQSRSWATSKSASPTNARSFKQIFSNHLDTFIDRYMVKNAFAFEVSGGIDSTTLPLYWLSRSASNHALMGTMVYPGELGVSQTSKITALVERGLQSVTIPVDIDIDYPLARFHNKPQTFYSFEEIYTEPLTKLADKLADKGVSIIFTGIGGDECFENTASLEDEFGFGTSVQQERTSGALPSYLTEQFRYEWTTSTPQDIPYPVPLLSKSYHGASLARNNIYIEHGIWPISPFASPNFYEYAQGLPIGHRSNKNILRAFHQAYDFPEIIYNNPINENFASFFVQSFLSDKYEKLFSSLITKSKTAKLGYVDKTAVISAWQTKGNLPASNQRDSLLFHLFGWLTAEMNLQAIKDD